MAKEKSVIPVTKPYLPPLEEVVSLMGGVWDSRVLTNGGPLHQRLELELAEYLGVPFVSLFANGTLALQTAFQALKLRGEVITTPYSFVATSHALLWNGLKPVFVDIEPDGVNINPENIERAITPETTAILPVHCYGIPCQVDALDSIADRFNLKVIYDAAHAFAVRMGGQSILQHGDLSVLSLHATKVFNTFEGGVLISHSARMKTTVDRLKNFGFVDEVTVAAYGINGKMSELNAAVGLVQLRHIDQVLKQRLEVAETYRHLLEDVPGLRLLPRPSAEVAWNGSYFPVFIEASAAVSRDALYQRLRDESILVRRYFYPLISDFPIYRSLPSASAALLPHASKLAQEVLCLPIYPELKIETVREVARIIRWELSGLSEDPPVSLAETNSAN